MNKRKVPKIRFKGFHDDWEQRKVSEIGNIITGSTPKTSISDNYGGEFLFVSPADIQGNRYVNETITTLTKKGFDQGRKIREKASLFVSIGSTIGKVAQTSQESTTNQQINAVEPYDNFDDDFTFTSLENVSGSIKAIASNQAVPIVNKTTFGETEIQVPSELAEQQKIGAYFRNLDHLITLHQRKLEKLKIIKKSMLENCFPKNGEKAPQIRFSGFSDDWEQRKLADIVERITRKNENLESTLPLTISAQYGLIDQNEFFDKRIASKDVSGYYLVRKGEFAYNKSTSSDAPWGAIKRLDRYACGVLSTLYIVFRILDEDKVNSDYLVTYYDTDIWHKGVQAIAAEGARNHGLLNIAPADFFETTVSVPKDIEEQRKIGAYIMQLDHVITLHQSKLEKLKMIKKSMLETMFV